MPAVVNPDGGDPQGDERRKLQIQESRTDDQEHEELRTNMARRYQRSGEKMEYVEDTQKHWHVPACDDAI